MKKTMFVMVLAAVLVFAFAASAMAGSIFNRSSAFLGTTTDRVNASGGTRAGYITWAQADTAVKNAAIASPSLATTGAAELMLLGPHSGYAMGTMKCQVCHSVHKALIDGNKLTAAPDNGCMTCHAAGSSFSSTQVAAGDSDQRHGSSCTTLCHTQNPHGGNVSKYGAAASALLHRWIDPTMDAAFASAESGEPEWAFYPVSTSADAIPGTPTWNAQDLYIEIFQPGITETNAESILNPSTPAEVTAGRAFVTGYVCANAGCHMNGAFNGLTNDSFYGEWRFRAAGSDGVYVAEGDRGDNFFSPNGDETGATTHANNRTRAIKGHTLYAYTNPDAAVETAWAASSTCKSCHDQIDARLGVESFPHSNRVWELGAGQPNGETMYNGTAYRYLYNTAAWFTLAENVNVPAVNRVNTNTRQVGTTASDVAPLTVGMDGACLKCHDTNDATMGVGKNF